MLHDFRYAVRMLLKSPGFTAVAVITLALGMGANLTMFNFAKAGMIVLPPVKDAGHIANLWASNRLTGQERSPATRAEFELWQQQARSFEDLTAYSGAYYTVGGGRAPTHARANHVSQSFFRLTGVGPLLGRTFAPEEFTGESAPVVVLSYGLWQRNFGGDRKVLGRAITIGENSYTIIGVMPAGFYYPASDIELYLPLGASSGLARRTVRSLFVVGRLRPGVSSRQAQAELDALAPRVQRELGDSGQGWGVNLRLLRDEQIKRAGSMLALLLGPVIFVLLIACANVGNMLLARASVRRAEIAVRVALGATRVRIVRQLLVESLLLAALGGALGFLLGIWGLHFVHAYFPGPQMQLARVKLDATLLLVGILMSVAAVAVFGLSPALRTSRINVNETLKTREAIGGVHRPRSLVVVCEIALAVVFPMVTLRMVRGLASIERGLLEPGFDLRNVLTLRLAPPSNPGRDTEGFYRDVMERIAAVPGVTATGVGDITDHLGGMGGRVSPSPLVLEGGRAGAQAFAVRYVASPGYLAALKLPLHRGRQFTEQDSAGSVPVALINETMAKRYWPGGEALGRRFKLGTGQDAVWTTVVGEVGDIMPSLRDNSVLPMVFLPYAQHPEASVTVAVRTGPPPANLLASVKSAVWSIDKTQALDYVDSVEEMIARQLAGSYFIIYLIGGFGVLALGLAAAGVYAVMNYSVAQRTREFGIRVALGAEPRDIGSMLLRQGAVLIGSGLFLGLAGTAAITRLLASELPGLRAADAPSFVACALGLATVALLAMYLPARRATRVDPMVALRYE